MSGVIMSGIRSWTITPKKIIFACSSVASQTKISLGGANVSVVSEDAETEMLVVSIGDR